MGFFGFLKKAGKKDEAVEKSPSIEQGGFEKAFTEVQKDMISTCLEYVEDKADKVYIYVCNEEHEICCDFFFEIAGKVYSRHKLPEGYDTDADRQFSCLDMLNHAVLKLRDLCNKYDNDAPSEMKIIYDAVNHKVDAKYRYGNVLGEDEMPEDVAEKWFNEISRSDLTALDQ